MERRAMDISWDDFETRTRKITLRVDAGYNDGGPKDYGKEINLIVRNDMEEGSQLMYIREIKEVLEKLARLFAGDMSRIMNWSSTEKEGGDEG